MDDGGAYITETLAGKFQTILNDALCTSDTTFVNTLVSERGVSCPPGTSMKDFGSSCDLSAVRFNLKVAPSARLGFPSRSSCAPANIVAGGGRAGCTICGDDSSNSVRELHIEIDGRDTDCAHLEMVLPIYDQIVAAAVADGVTLCPRDFTDDDGGSFINLVLPTKWSDILGAALCT